MWKNPARPVDMAGVSPSLLISLMLMMRNGFFGAGRCAISRLIVSVAGRIGGFDSIMDGGAVTSLASAGAVALAVR